MKKALAAWFSGIISAYGAVGREIESRQGIGWQIFTRKKRLKKILKAKKI
jgi:hypothetical protein